MCSLLLLGFTIWRTVTAPGPPRSQPATVGSTEVAIRAVTVDQAFARARAWRTAVNGKPVPYSMVLCYPDFTAVPCVAPAYRTDCSGYVSMILGLETSLVTGDMVADWFAEPLTKEQLRPGDLLVDPAVGAAGHVVLFEKWADTAHTIYWGYEQRGGYGTDHRRIPYPYFHDRVLKPYRYKGMRA